MTMLTKNFSLSEFTLSETAERKGMPNLPPPVALENLKRLAEVLEQVRELLGQQLNITSGYRSPDLNRLIGGSPNSAHMQGLAADFTCPSLAPVEICKRIDKSEIAFDQLIHEYKWVHFAIAQGEVAPRRQLLSLKPGGGYYAGIA